MGLNLLGFFGTEILGDIQLLIQTVLYFLIVLFGMMSAIPVGTTSNNFDGGCLLYGKINIVKHGTPDDTRIMFRINYGPKSACDYVIAIHVLFCVLYGLAMAVLFLFTIIKRMRQGDFNLVKTFLFNVVALGATCFIGLLCFISACVAAVGFKNWCNELLETYPSQNKCSDFQEWIQWEKYDGGSFHKSLSLASTCCFLVTLCWVLQGALHGLTVYKQRKTKGSAKSPASTAASTPTSAVSTLSRF